MLEEKYGSQTIIEIICITAFITGLLNWILFPHVALLGASGVVGGLSGFVMNKKKA